MGSQKKVLTRQDALLKSQGDTEYWRDVDTVQSNLHLFSVDFVLLAKRVRFQTSTQRFIHVD
jgi:hypothetical protein